MISATYRLQFHKGFTFADAAAQAGYFAALGISHVYASPILTARAGSMHGYDVVDHSRINPELGGEAGFRAMAAALKAQGIGLIVDIVPNHMAVGGKDNAWWLDLLANGRSSRFAETFDVDWDTPGLEGKVLAPFLDGDPAALLAKGELQLVREEGQWAFAYFDHRFPVRPQDQGDAATTPAAELLARQNFVLADWRQANDRINWRRFFDITELAAIRVAEPAVFDAVHGKIFALFAEGLIDGVRVDHIDGIADPATYCRVLRDRLAAAGRQPYIIVEKILAEDEQLASAWAVDGTTGYEVMNDLAALIHQGSAAPALDALWAEHGARDRSFEQEEIEARRFILSSRFGAQLAATARAFAGVLTLPEADVAQALTGIILRLRCYRSYATGKPGTPGAGGHLDRAIAQARREVDAPALAAIAALFDRDDGDPQVVDALRRFHQLCAPVAAKAVEDTAFYRYGRILSRNDVGFDPRRTALSANAFHQRVAARAAGFPRSMATTATHDHKRGEDARARIAALSSNVGAWEAFLGMAMKDYPSSLASGDVYQLLQTILGFWEEGEASMPDRLETWGRKFLREEKLRSSWDAPDTAYEDAFCGFARDLVSSPGRANFRTALKSLQDAIAPQALAGSIAQTVLRYTIPGVPDLYQGTEYDDLSLVDPDNRRPVDFVARAKTLADGTSPKQKLIHLLLQARRADPQLWVTGNYQPVLQSDDVVAFERRHGASMALIVVKLRGSALDIIRLEQKMRDIFTGRSLAAGPHAVSDILGDATAAVLVPSA